MYLDIEKVVETKISELSAVGREVLQGAGAAVLAKLYVESGPALVKWPRMLPVVEDALALALRQLAGIPGETMGRALEALNAFDVEDDGSGDWQALMDACSLLVLVLEGRSAESCTSGALRMYLEGRYNVLANEIADLRGGVVSDVDAEELLKRSVEWRRAISFVEGL